ncbi:DUF58 domain-containing protein [Galbitalea soli]|uniref:DUF58 domain-containing protein n=1 Tax=Galbitalea soli TaxID=1268042 RepID=A0A7C9PMJ9_9MICO|nr:DUF58 domain-containing protein [Galbitalea soli]NEM90831.1 DUF58 domain-containing protein [Galbitalea soli]NYJ31551.1 uncharacterized protein (DUF58 family) [Galbitalea soli]
MAVSGRLVLLVAIGAIPIVVIGAPIVLVAWIALAILLVVLDLILAGSPRAVSVQRDPPSRVRLGDTVRADALVTNRGRRRIRGVIRDAWQPSAGATVRRVRVDIPSGETRTVSTPLTPFRRGERSSAALTIRSFGPLGLAARQASIVAPGAIRVLPAFASRKHLPSRLARLRELDGRTSVMIRGQGTEFDSLREYVRGDDVRSIDWRATARRSGLVVRTWRPERDRRVVVVIDSGRTSAARIDREPRIDTAFESTLLLAALASRAGDRVDVVVFDRRVRGRVQGFSGAELMSTLVDTMSPIEPELIEMDWTAVPALVRSITSQRALVVLATSIDAPGSSRGLLSVLPELARKHMVVVASVTDPSVLDAAADHTDAEAVYRAAAAERALLDITRVSAAIRQLGADVVTGAPAALPPALADRYLALKAAGRL